MSVVRLVNRERAARGIDAGGGAYRSDKPLADCRYAFALLDGLANTRPVDELANLTWARVVEKLVGASPVIGTDKATLPYFLPAELQDAEFVGATLDQAKRNGRPTTGRMRSANHIKQAGVLAFDLDDLPTAEWEGIAEALDAAGVAYAAYSTFSHGMKPGLARVRVLIPLDKPVTRQGFATCWGAVNRGLLRGKADKASERPEQAAGVWMAHPDRKGSAFRRIQNGAPLSVETLLRPTPNLPLVPPSTINGELSGGLDEPYALPDSIPDGGRNSELLSYAGSLRAKGFTESQIVDLVSTANRERCSPPLDDSEVEQICARYATTGGEEDTRQVGAQDAPANSGGDKALPQKIRAAVELAGGVSLDQFGVCRLLCKQGSRVEALDIQSSRARDHLILLVHKATGSVPGKELLDREIALVRAGARQKGARCHVVNRVATDEKGYYLDLNNQNGDVVRVDATGWDIEQSPPGIYFIRDDKTGELPQPIPAGSVPAAEALIGEFLKTLAIPTELHLPVIVALCEWLRPETPFTIMEFIGPAGSGKTTAANCIIRTIDPPRTPHLPEVACLDHRAIGAVAAQRYVLAKDNVSKLSVDEQDLLCKTATGAELNSRMLYTDADTVTLSIARPFILTAITPAITRGDLTDRSIRVTIPQRQGYTPTGEMNRWFENGHPHVLGALLDLLAAGLRHIPEVRAQVTLKHRLADFELLGEAIGAALGHPPGEFSELFSTLRSVQAADVLEGDEVGRILVEVLHALGTEAVAADKLPPWRTWWEKPKRFAVRMADGGVIVAIRSGELVDRLQEAANREHYNEYPHRRPGIPGNGRALKGALTRLQPLLRDSGIHWEERNIRGEKNRAHVFVFQADGAA